MCKEQWIERYEQTIVELAEEHDLDPFEMPEHLEELAIQIAEKGT